MRYRCLLKSIMSSVSRFYEDVIANGCRFRYILSDLFTVVSDDWFVNEYGLTYEMTALEYY